MIPVFETITLPASMAAPQSLDMEGFNNLSIFTAVPDILLGAEFQMSRSITLPLNLINTWRNISARTLYLSSQMGGGITVSRW